MIRYFREGNKEGIEIRGWKITNILTSEVYIVKHRDLKDEVLKDIIKTFSNMCPNYSECYIILEKDVDNNYIGFIVFDGFEDTHKILRILALCEELEIYSEFGYPPRISYLNEDAEILVIKLYPTAEFVGAVLRSAYKKYKFRRWKIE